MAKGQLRPKPAKRSLGGYYPARPASFVSPKIHLSFHPEARRAVTAAKSSHGDFLPPEAYVEGPLPTRVVTSEEMRQANFDAAKRATRLRQQKEADSAAAINRLPVGVNICKCNPGTLAAGPWRPER